MENSPSSTNQTKSPWAVIAVIVVLVIVVVGYFALNKDEEKLPPKVVETNQNEVEVAKVEAPIEEIIEQAIEPMVEFVEPETAEEVIPEEPMPTLDESDDWIRENLPKITWRQELLKLIIDQDMIRRLVVFTDNFAQGNLAYEHSLVVKPTAKFSVREITQEGNTIYKWDESITRRFSLYVDLLRSVDSDMLIEWYIELKPLIDEAYQELGYPDSDFTDTLQDAITRVLDMEIPREEIELVRPSVMYQYKDPSIEQLPDADKLLLRLGKENLLVIKSVLLEISEKLSRTRD